jgi:hypothetical protein
MVVIWKAKNESCQAARHDPYLTYIHEKLFMNNAWPKLVDIERINILRLEIESMIDDPGYTVCDLSCYFGENKEDNLLINFHKNDFLKHIPR